MKMILAIAFGGALGAVGRHLVATQVSHLFGAGFPVGTLAVNLLGSFAIGLLVEAAALVWAPPAELRAFLAVGFLGSFTTFSTFSMEAVLLYDRGALVLMAAYVVLSVAACVAGVLAGMQLVRFLAV